MKKLLAFIILTALLLTFAACGGDNESSVAESSAVESTAESSEEPISEEVSEATGKFFIETAEMTRDGKLVTKSEYLYNPETGDLLCQTAYDEDGEYMKVENYYDEQNRLVKTVSTYTDSQDVDEYTAFDENGNPTEGTMTVLGKVTKFKKTYDEEGRVLSFEVADETGKTFYKEENEYFDDNGSYHQKSLGGNDVTVIMNEKGLETRRTYTNEDGETVADYYYVYDDAGNLVSSGSIDDGDYLYENVYENGVLISVNVKCDGEAVSSTTYEYDEYGNVLKETVTEKDKETGKDIVTVTAYTYIELNIQ
ncbi:MAG: hypothetical protein KBS44_07745 [Clostridiales bacterium]|nr:hypothetical protein [Candidatus Coliplasma equi]